MQKIVDWAVLIAIIICVLLFIYAYNTVRINKSMASSPIEPVHGEIQKEVVL